MSGWWILTIICGVLLIVGVVLIIIGDKAFVEVLVIIGIVATLASGGCGLGCCLTAISNTREGRAEYESFLTNRAFIEEVVTDSTGDKNIGINNAIIEANKWLADAQADKKVYGIFSKYYGLPIDDIEPIKINSKITNTIQGGTYART